MIIQKIKQELDQIKKTPSRLELAEHIKSLDITLAELEAYIEDTDGFPYGRKLLYKSDFMEVLVMNWALDMDCSPHDHGSSRGYIQVIKGNSRHTIYKLQDGVPQVAVEKVEEEGSLFYAPKGIVHKMGAMDNQPLVTLHYYTPPISNMKVFDIEKCKSCIVRDDCGAWWPKEQKMLLEELSLV